MVQIELTSQDVSFLRDIIARYLPDLEIEIADTDDKEFRQFLQGREKFMQEFLHRLDTIVSA